MPIPTFPARTLQSFLPGSGCPHVLNAHDSSGRCLQDFKDTQAKEPLLSLPPSKPASSLQEEFVQLLHSLSSSYQPNPGERLREHSGGGGGGCWQHLYPLGAHTHGKTDHEQDIPNKGVVWQIRGDGLSGAGELG